MPIVKVWNDNQYEHCERFKGEEIRISPGGFVEMDYIDAVDFRGQFTTPKMLGPNNPDPRHFKMIRVEEPTEPVVKDDKTVHHATGKAFESTADLIEFAKAYAKANADLAVVNPEAEAEARRRHESNDALLARIAALEAQVAQQPLRAKPGPKPKVAI
jgi:hypothetical protein